ncbi:atp-dependent RNA helicase suv3 protein [Rutstroemia sp. NJR-2017a WRK4]|nr:atp-dependent RNA helicase suv3 protein [Rutstroemia sp. NJR-2017a WRK4]
MSLVNRRSGQCTLCAFRAAAWLSPFVLDAGRKKFHQSSYNQRVAKKAPPRKRVDFSALRRNIRPREENENYAWKESRNTAIARKPSKARTNAALDNFVGIVFKEINILRGLIIRKGVEKILGVDLAFFKAANQQELLDKFEDFIDETDKACDEAIAGGDLSANKSGLFWQLKNAFVTGDIYGLKDQLKYAFMNFIVEKNLTPEIIERQRKLADARYPAEWYPATRAMHREIHLHVGPTNSGKTYHALQRLEAANTGIYAGPLRLLAHEVYMRFNAKGKPCALITGEERRVPEGVKNVMKSCTVEMVPLNTPVEVAVIDEIQMIGDVDRGWAWTAAVLGVQAKEVHLCGELRTIDLIKKLCALTGDKLIIHKYERLGKLELQQRVLSGPKSLEKGDAVILFSRMEIHAMKKAIEKVHPDKRCAVVYGSLPPETRAQQAALFNDPDNEYDFLVASNAIGMGLNLSIKRVIFNSVTKFNGVDVAILEIPDIKQIAGRAGRFKTASQAVIQGPIDVDDGETPVVAVPAPPPVGYVTTFEHNALSVIKRALQIDAPMMKTAGIFPPWNMIESFSQYFPKGTPLSYMILRLHKMCELSSHFHNCRLKEQVQIADLIQNIPLTIRDRLTFLAAPVNLREPDGEEIVRAFARCISEQSSGHLLDIPELKLEILDAFETPVNSSRQINVAESDYEWRQQNEVDKERLRALEAVHKHITLYLWLSYRFAGVFKSQAMAFHVKGLIEERIDELLCKVNASPSALRAMEKKRLKREEKLQRMEAMRMREELEDLNEGRIVPEREAEKLMV